MRFSHFSLFILLESSITRCVAKNAFSVHLFCTFINYTFRVALSGEVGDGHQGTGLLGSGPDSWNWCAYV